MTSRKSDYLWKLKNIFYECAVGHNFSKWPVTPTFLWRVRITLYKSGRTTCACWKSVFVSAYNLYVQVGSRDSREVTNFARLGNFQLPVLQNVGFLDYSLHNQSK